MLILKHVEYQIPDTDQLDGLLEHLKETTSKIDGIILKDIYFPKGKSEFVLFLECKSEKEYYDWREICPPPPGAKDWHDVLLSTDEHFPT